MILSPLKEMDIYGVFVPSVLVWGILSFIAVKIVHKALARHDFYRSDAEQQWFDFALFILFTSLLTFSIF